MRSQLRLLIAQKEQAEGRNISLRSIARDADVPISTVNGLANNTLQRVALPEILKLCTYLGCDVGDLFKIEEVPV